MSQDFLANYKAKHQHPLNRLSHSIGIPLIVISLPLFFFNWRWALALFVVGWIFSSSDTRSKVINPPSSGTPFICWLDHSGCCAARVCSWLRQAKTVKVTITMNDRLIKHLLYHEDD